MTRAISLTQTQMHRALCRTRTTYSTRYDIINVQNDCGTDDVASEARKSVDGCPRGGRSTDERYEQLNAVWPFSPSTTLITSMNAFTLVAPSTRGLSLALTRHLLRTTSLPVYATYRTGKPEQIHDTVFSALQNTNVDPSRLKLFRLDLTSEDSIASAAEQLDGHLQTQRKHSSDAAPYLHTAFFTGGVLHPERQPADLDIVQLQKTFQINTLGHLLLIKHFARFLPAPGVRLAAPSKWVHLSARVGSVSDNRRGGWYSYRASKAALNQVIKTFDLHLQARRVPAIAVGIHPGTVRTDLSKEFWAGVKEGQLFEPEDAAEKVIRVVEGLSQEQRGRIWDWKGDEIAP